MNTAIILTILAGSAVLIGWIAPMLINSPRPYGLIGDLAASMLAALVFGLIEWLWLLPALNITGLVGVLIAILDPLFGSLIALWLLRKIKPVDPIQD